VSDQTFEQLWKRLRVYAPELPLPLAQEFVNTAYSTALSWGDWYGVTREAEFSIPDPVTAGTVSVVNGSATVTGSSTAWASTLIGRQFFTEGSGPFYTITAVAGPTSLTLDRVWGKPDASGVTYSIQTIYVSPPTDFLHFTTVVDLDNNWRLRVNISQDLLDTWDSKRSTAGTSWTLAPAPPGASGEIRYELWPRANSAKTYHYRYSRKPPLLSAPTDRPIFPIRGDVLRHGALAELCLWPGTSTAPNPYFNLQSHELHERLFKESLAKTQREDQEISQTDLSYATWESLPWAPLDAAFIQSHGLL
jgi:hypothetical protein